MKTLLALLLMVTALAVHASELDDILGGFDETKSTENTVDDILDGFDNGAEVSAPAKTLKPDLYAVHGFLKLGTDYSLNNHSPASDDENWQGLTKLRGELQLELDIYLPKKWRGFISGKAMYDAAYRINGRNRYEDETISAYESEIELRDTYIIGSLSDSVDIKFGRQIVPWGKSDNLRITDVINPLDGREPGLTDIEDIRMPVTMTKLDYYFGKWNLSGMVIHEIRFNKTPEYGHDFYPSAVKLPPEDKPEHAEFAVALNGNLSGWDLSIYAADIYDDSYHMENDNGIRRKHSRVKMLGTAVNIASGNWLIKTEAAHFSGLEFFNCDDKYQRTDALIGFEYSGFTNTKISFEIADRYIHAHKDLIANAPDYTEKNDVSSAIRINRTFMREKLDTTILIMTFNGLGQDGAMQRFSAEYELDEGLSITGGAVFYKSGGEKLYKNIGDNDRLFAEIKYSF